VQARPPIDVGADARQAGGCAIALVDGRRARLQIAVAGGNEQRVGIDVVAAIVAPTRLQAALPPEPCTSLPCISVPPSPALPLMDTLCSVAPALASR